MTLMRNFASVAAVALTSLLAATPTLVHAAVYDLKTDWSDAANPNGAWTLRQGGTALPSVANWQGFNNPAWAPSNNNGDFLPAFFKANGVGSDDCATCNWLAGDVVVHTQDRANGANEGVANVLFVAPTSGFADISGLTWAGRSIGREQGWILFINGVNVANGLLPGDGSNGRSNADTFSLSHVALTANEQIELQLYQHAGDGLGDFVGLNLHVDLTPSAGGVPEPAAWAMMLVGFGGLGAVLRRRRSALLA